MATATGGFPKGRQRPARRCQSRLIHALPSTLSRRSMPNCAVRQAMERSLPRHGRTAAARDGCGATAGQL